MEKKEAKQNNMVYHIILGTISIAYSIGVALRLYIPTLHDNESYISGIYWLIFYVVVSYVIFTFMKSLIDTVSCVYVPYLILMGCCEGVSCVAFCSYFTWMPGYSYSAGAAIGILLSLLIIYFQFPKASPFLFISNIPGDIVYGTAYGIAIAWIVTPILFPDGATDAVGNMALYCFDLSIVSVIFICIGLTCIVRLSTARRIKKFEAERQKVMKDQDLYDERCAKAKAEKEAKAKAEQERARKERERRERERQERERNERARKEREERNRRYNQQKGSNNRSSSSGGSSHRYTGSWNNTANSYFKGCSNKAELKRRYRQLCKKLHPDCPGGSAESFRIMKSEYESLYNKMAG